MEASPCSITWQYNGILHDGEAGVAYCAMKYVHAYDVGRTRLSVDTQNEHISCSQLNTRELVG